MSNERLSNDVRTAIIGAAMKAKFDPREAAFEAAKTQFADAVYAHLVPPKEEAMIRKLPRRWYDLGDTLNIHAEGFHYQGEGFGNDYRAEMVSSKIKLSKERPFPSFGSEDTKLEEGHPLWGMSRVLVAERASILADRETLRQQLRTIVYAAQTRKRLLEIWPEGEKFMPEPKHPISTALVPIDTVKAVNAALGLP